MRTNYLSAIEDKFMNHNSKIEAIAMARNSNHPLLASLKDAKDFVETLMWLHSTMQPAQYKITSNPTDDYRYYTYGVYRDDEHVADFNNRNDADAYVAWRKTLD